MGQQWVTQRSILQAERRGEGEGGAATNDVRLAARDPEAA